MCRAKPSPIENRELHHFRKIVETAPGGKLRDIVFADQANELRVWLATAERFDCLDGVRRRRPLELQSIETKSRLALNCRPQHFHASIGPSWRPSQLVRRESSGDENQVVELQLLDRVPREDQMPMVDGIEGPAEDADLLSQRNLVSQFEAKSKVSEWKAHRSAN